MKRQLILGLVLVAMILIALGVYFGIDAYQTQQEEDSAEELAALQLTNIDTDSVTKLVLHSPDLDYTIELDEDDSTWVVTEGTYSYINTNYITILCNYGCELSASENLGEVDQEKIENYGLDDPVSITYYTSSGNYTIYVGDLTPTNEYFYMMVEDDDNVYLVDADTAGYLYVTESQLRNRYIVTDSTSEFTHISLQEGDTYIYDFEITDDNWVMVEPITSPISLDYSKISSLSIDLIEMEIDDFGDTDISEEDYEDYGIDENCITLHFEQENGESVTLLFENDDESDDYINCVHVEEGDVYIFDSSYLSFLEDETEDYLVSYIYKPTQSDVTEMTISYAGSFNDQTLDFSTTFTLDFDSETYACDGTDFSDSEDAVEAFEELYDRAVGLSYESIDPDAEDPGYDEDDVALQISFTLSDDTVETVELIPCDDTHYWAYIDGEFTYALVRQKKLSGNDRLLECYTEFMEALESTE